MLGHYQASVAADPGEAIPLGKGEHEQYRWSVVNGEQCTGIGQLFDGFRGNGYLIIRSEDIFELLIAINVAVCTAKQQH